MILTTANTLPDNLYEITEIIGPVGSEVVFGVNIGKDFVAGLTNVFGGRSGTYEKEIRGAINAVLKTLEENAAAMGADAVIAMQHDYITFGSGNSMISSVINGTAVKIRAK